MMCARESRRWVSEREVRRERWWVNWLDSVGAAVVKDCFANDMPGGVMGGQSCELERGEKTERAGGG